MIFGFLQDGVITATAPDSHTSFLQVFYNGSESDNENENYSVYKKAAMK